MFDDIDVLARERDAGSRFREIHNRQANEKRRRGRDFKKNQRFEPHSADFFQRAAASDADDDGGKD